MRQEIQNLFNGVIAFKYSLPNGDEIEKTCITEENDYCFEESNESLSVLIYRALIDYCFSEQELLDKDPEMLLRIAIQERIKFKGSADKESELLKQGFFGEILLYCFLWKFFDKKTLISRGFFYDPTAKKETSGYDSFHFADNGGKIELWFGEVKFHKSLTGAISSVLKGLNRVFKDAYFKKNLIAIISKEYNVRSSEAKKILKDWRENGYQTNVDQLVKENNIELIYPVLLVYDKIKADYDDEIKRSINIINNNVNDFKKGIGIKSSIFFVLLPVQNSRQIKLEVLKWIKPI